MLTFILISKLDKLGNKIVIYGKFMGFEGNVLSLWQMPIYKGYKTTLKC